MKRLGLLLTFIFVLSFSAKLFSQEILWEKSYKSPMNYPFANLSQVKEMNDGSFLILYSVWKDDTPTHSLPVVTKISADGKMIWASYKDDANRINPYFLYNFNDTSFNCFGFRVKAFGIDGAIGFNPVIYTIDTSGNFVNQYIDTLSEQKTIWDDAGPVITEESSFMNIGSDRSHFIVKKFDDSARFIEQFAIDTLKKYSWPVTAYQLPDKGYLVTGQFNPGGLNYYFLIRYSSIFKRNWIVCDSSDTERSILFSDIYKPEDSSLIVLGSVYPIRTSDSVNRRFFIRKYNFNGELAWSKEYRNTKWFRVNSILETNDKGFMIVGDTSSSNYTDHAFFIFKTDKNGDMIYKKFWGDDGIDNLLYSAIQLKDGNILVAGVKDKSLYIAKIKDNTIGTTEESNTSRVTLDARIFPQPASKEFNVEINLVQAANVSVDIFDSNSNRVMNGISKYMEDGSHTISMNTEEIASGVYYCRVRAGNREITKKFVVIR